MHLRFNLWSDLSDVLFVVNLGVWRWFTVRMKDVGPQFASLDDFLFRFTLPFMFDIRCPADAIYVFFRF